MVERSNLITRPFGAYDRRHVEDHDRELTEVGRGTPCGEYLRRFWQPVARGADLGDLPLAIRILGEDLVLFRDGGGRVGLLEKHCCHRGTSLEFGKICETGIRCCYHGWHFDIDGTILETPFEPPESKVRTRMFQGAYPTHEYRGAIFAYLGPADRRPAFPVFDAFEREATTYDLRKRVSPCNWLQVRENETDPLHLVFLHTRLFGVQFREVYGGMPTVEWQETPLGLLYKAVWRWGDHLYLRCNDMIMPTIVRVAGIEDGEGETLFDRRGSVLNWVVPIDDTTTMSLSWSDIDKDLAVPGNDGYADRALKTAQRRVGSGDVGQTGDAPYEERQRAPGDWDAWASQGAQHHHSRENLATSDRGVSLYRRMLREGIRAVARGEDPQGLIIEAPDKPIMTYCHNTVLAVPPGASEDEERDRKLAFGRTITEAILSGALRKTQPGAEPLSAAPPLSLPPLSLATGDQGS